MTGVALLDLALAWRGQFEAKGWQWMEIALVVVGWLLGLLTSPITDAIGRVRERRDLARALRVELTELRLRLAGYAWYVWSKQGDLTMERVEWCARTLEASPGDETATGMAQNIRGILSNGEQQLNLMNAHNRASSNNQSTMSSRKVEAPFLSAHLHRLIVLKPKTQQQLLGIDSQLRILNELVDEHSLFFQLTFNGDLRDENREVVMSNLRRTAGRIADRAMYIGKAIEAIAFEEETGWT